MTTINPVAQQSPDRRVPMSTAANMRDLGGLPADGGVIGTGRLFRSASLSSLAGADLANFAGLGITTVFDLRTGSEIEQAPDQLPETTASVHLNVLGDDPESTAAGLAVLGGDAHQLEASLGNGGGVTLMKDSYRQIVGLDSARQAYHDFITSLADPKRTGAALFHCTTGKDRTGWAAVLVLRMLGVDEDAVVADYLETNDDLLPALQPMLDKAAANGVPTDLLTPVVGVRLEYLETADHEVKSRYGSFETYVSEGLGIDRADRGGAARATAQLTADGVSSAGGGLLRRPVRTYRGSMGTLIFIAAAVGVVWYWRRHRK
ncbi:MAG: tyrosine-protein phosphatase [Acidipropionibacterium sp.]|nr:tyrosine-protein phosphatase [Acidipropionibacterium sp.]